MVQIITCYFFNQNSYEYIGAFIEPAGIVGIQKKSTMLICSTEHSVRTLDNNSRHMEISNRDLSMPIMRLIDSSIPRPTKPNE